MNASTPNRPTEWESATSTDLAVGGSPTRTPEGRTAVQLPAHSPGAGEPVRRGGTNLNSRRPPFPAAGSQGYAPGLDHYGFVIRRQWWVILAAAALGLLVAMSYLVLTPPSYTARSDVKLNVIATNPFSGSRNPASLLDTATEIQIASSSVVAEKAAQALGGSITASELRHGLSVKADEQASLVHLQYSAPTSKDAVAGADALAQAFLEYRSSAAQQTINAMLKNIEAPLANLQAQLIDANARRAATSATTAAGIKASTDRDVIKTEIDDLLSQRANLAQIDTTGGSVLAPADSNPVTQAPQVPLTLLEGALAGGVLGLILAFPLSAANRRMRTKREVERVPDLNVLAHLSARTASLPERGSTLDTLRVARERLLSELGPAAGILAVVDDSPGPVPSDVPINLAVTIAQTGRATQIVLLGTDPAFQTRVAGDLALMQAGSDEHGTLFDCPFAPALQIYFASTGQEPDEPDRYVTQSVARRALSAGGDRLLIIALPPRAARCSQLAAERIADATLVVVARGASRSNELTRLTGDISELGKDFVGTITVPRRRALPASPTGA